MSYLSSIEFQHREIPDKGYCYDILIDGKSLMDMFPEKVGQLIPLGLGYKDLDCELNDLKPFIEPSEVEEKNPFVTFFVCGECRDESCGVETAKISFEENSVRWDQFESHPEFCFEFGRKTYFDAFADLRECLIKNHKKGVKSTSYT